MQNAIHCLDLPDVRRRHHCQIDLVIQIPIQYITLRIQGERDPILSTRAAYLRCCKACSLFGRPICVMKAVLSEALYGAEKTGLTRPVDLSLPSGPMSHCSLRSPGLWCHCLPPRLTHGLVILRQDTVTTLNVVNSDHVMSA